MDAETTASAGPGAEPSGPAGPAGDDADRLLEAERAGLRLAALCRAAGLAALALFALGSAASWQTRLLAGGALAGFAGLGFAYLLALRLGRDRPWMKYALAALDYAALGLMYARLPVSLSGETEQILAFRIFDVLPLLLPVALAALSLSSRLVLFAGGAAAVSWWAAWLWVVSGMERTVSWGDLPPGAGAEAFYEIYLSPVFIGRGDRVTETIGLLTIAGVLALAVGRARKVLQAQLRAEAERAFVARAFGEYVPAEAARQILADREALAPQMRRASVLSVDIAGFTSLAEAMGPEEVIRCLNAFFADASDAVAEAGGVIVDFSGDGFLAAFNAPIEVPDPEARAVRAARAVLALTEAQVYGGRRLSVRAGIATGDLAAGSVGGAGRRTYTVYGDVVNLAARLQEMGKTLGRGLLTDAATARAAGAGLGLLQAGAPIRGRAAPEDVHGLV